MNGTAREAAMTAMRLGDPALANRILQKSKSKMPTMQDLLSKATVASPEESAKFFNENDFRWSETVQGGDSPTGEPIIYINDKKFRDAGIKNYRDKAALSESIHLMKNYYPEQYNALLGSAMQEPEVANWLQESYKYSVNEGEKRPFEDWLRQSRFDQVLGGYIFAQDPAFPTMSNWRRDKLPFGKAIPQAAQQLMGTK